MGPGSKCQSGRFLVPGGSVGWVPTKRLDERAAPAAAGFEFAIRQIYQASLVCGSPDPAQQPSD